MAIFRLELEHGTGHLVLEHGDALLLEKSTPIVHMAMNTYRLLRTPFCVLLTLSLVTLAGNT